MDNVITRGPRDYVEIPWQIEEAWKVLDVGPGTYPFMRANVFADWDEETLKGIRERFPEVETWRLIDASILPFPDKAFDYVWCSHVLEHVDDPATCAAELSRVGNCGTIVMPSAVKESIFNFEEIQHKWLVVPHPSAGIPIFIKHHKRFMERIKDIEVQKSTCRLYRTGPGHDCSEANLLQDWFWRNEKYLDVVYHWRGSLEIMVIQ